MGVSSIGRKRRAGGGRDRRRPPRWGRATGRPAYRRADRAAAAAAEPAAAAAAAAAAATAAATAVPPLENRRRAAADRVRRALGPEPGVGRVDAPGPRTSVGRPAVWAARYFWTAVGPPLVEVAAGVGELLRAGRVVAEVRGPSAGTPPVGGAGRRRTR